MTPSTGPLLPIAPMACPQCHTPIKPEDATCPVCGANILLVTLMAEYQLIERTNSGTGKLRPPSIEQLVPRLGEYLVRAGYLTEEQLRAALKQQKTASQSGHNSLIGQTLIEMGYLTREQLDQVIAKQIIKLQKALIEANRSLEKRVGDRTAELETTLIKLAELNRLKANFIANISHELRTPLTQIKGYNSLLGDAILGPLTTEQEEALNITARSIERLEQLINDLIAYAASAKGDLTLKLEAVPAQSLIKRVMAKSLEKARKRNITLTVQAPLDLPLVYADEEKLYWVLLQLVDNAVKFTEAGGKVIISAGVEGRRVLFAVRDTGLGIPADRQNEIFEPFQQLDGSTTRQHGGTGLGLALVRRIIEAHGADITIESQLGQGSTFRFSLPQPTAETEPPAQAESPTA